MKHANVAIFVPHLGCPHNCSFCNQRRISGHSGVPTPEQVRQTASRALEELGENAAESEIAFFGGSFTAIDRPLMESLLAAAAPFTGPGKFRGIRLSTRPDAIDGEILSILKYYHVSSIELGAQSMDDRVLALNERGHTAADVRNACRQIKKAGFELGLQMMTGLYGEPPEGAMDTARAIAELSPATVRIYPTIVLRSTLLADLYLAGKYVPQTLEQAVPLCSRLLVFFEKKGIRVIRLGLHASEGIQSGYLAGPWHPAFRELCEGELYLAKAKEAVKEISGRDVTLLVEPRAVSKLAGQHRRNILALEKSTGAKIRIKGCGGMEPYAVRACET